MLASRIDYVLYHLSFMSDNINELVKYCRFINNGDKITGANQICFRLGDGKLLFDEIKWIDELPILYPLSNNEFWYRFDDAGNLIFEHDLLQSAFYLLSARQEVEGGAKDDFGRFVYEGSLQQRLGIAHKPVVNHYFQIILEAFAVFCGKQGLRFDVRKPFSPFVFFLSHDIDRLYFHHTKEAAGRVLQLIGVRQLEYKRRDLCRLLVSDAFKCWDYKHKDPWSNFDFLISSSLARGIKSTFYFLPKTDSRLDSRYRFSDADIRQTIGRLADEDFEVGLHIPLSNSSSKYCYLNELSRLVSQKRLGVRRHYLAVEYPQSYVADSTQAVLYDASFGFHEHEGFRNSFCLPFKPYDHANERMVDAWIVPLCAMDVTFLYKRGLRFMEIEGIIDQMASEVERFGGVLSLLWHNCRFDEINFPGITRFYERVLDQMVQKKARCLSGREVVAEIGVLTPQSSFINDFNTGLISNE